MTIAHVVSAGAASTNNNSVTTSGADTSGANFLALCVGDFNVRAAVSDSKGNSYTGLTAQNISGGRGTRIWYSENPTVGASHTFTASATNSFPAVGAAAFSGVALGSAFDQQNGATNTSGTATTVNTGTVTPSADGELLITCGCESGAASGFPVPSGFTQIANNDGTAHAVGLGSGYQIQTTATARNPAWARTVGTSNGLAAVIATFRALAAIGRGLLTLGCGA